MNLSITSNFSPFTLIYGSRTSCQEMLAGEYLRLIRVNDKPEVVTYVGESVHVILH